VDRQPIFLTDHDRRFFIDAMEEGLAEVGAATAAYALMPNHFHWEVVTGEAPFEKAFRYAMSRHAARFNRLYSRAGHLFEARHWSFQVEEPGRCIGVAAYIHLNPVKGRLVAEPSAWEWSSYKEWCGSERRLVDFDRLAEVSGISPEELVKRHGARVESEMSRRWKSLAIEGLIDDVAALFGLSAAQLKSGRISRECTLAKRLIIDRGTESGHTIEELAKALGCTREALYLARRRAI
jgi:REP element-mobilizing transposase RayT